MMIKANEQLSKPLKKQAFIKEPGLLLYISES